MPPNRVFYSENDYVAELKHNLQYAYAQATKNIQSSQLRNKLAYDKYAKANTFEKGEMVKLRAEGVRQGRSKHLQPQFIGPYIIIEKINDFNYKIKMGRKTDIVHIDRLEKYY